LSFEVKSGQICGLIGPNGAGKTTMLNCVSRIYQPASGSIDFDGADLLGVAPSRLAQLGIGRTFQNLALFPALTVLENAMVGAHVRCRANFLTAPFRIGVGREERDLTRRAMRILTDLGLEEFAFQYCTGLPYATLKRIEIARAMACDPRLLLLDEPAGGLNHEEVRELSNLIRRLRDELGLTILLVEHHMQLLMGVSDRVVVLDFGRKIAEGSPVEVCQDRNVINAYLGDCMVDTTVMDGSESAAAVHSGGASSRPRELELQGSAYHSNGAGRVSSLESPSVPTIEDKALLDVKDLRALYGPAPVLHGLNFHVAPGEIVVLLGANGAGKTTTLRAICQMDVVSTSGSVMLNDHQLIGEAASTIVGWGVAHVPQGRGTFPGLTVEENLRAGAFVRNDNEIPDDIARWYDVFPTLAERRHQLAGNLSGGEQQMLAIARALMSRPQLLLLDEPSLGLGPLLVEELFHHLTLLREREHTTMLLVEQNATLALDVAHRAYVLEAGAIALSGDAEELKTDDMVRRTYLGV
jgi:branched-chain amino acid transport system ATP-binding protein